MTAPRLSQFGMVAVITQAPPAIRLSQFGMVAVVSNNKPSITLGPVIGLSCWSPCAILAHRFGDK
jgi:hypothetical protein